MCPMPMRLVNFKLAQITGDVVKDHCLSTGRRDHHTSNESTYCAFPPLNPYRGYYLSIHSLKASVRTLGDSYEVGSIVNKDAIILYCIGSIVDDVLAPRHAVSPIKGRISQQLRWKLPRV